MEPRHARDTPVSDGPGPLAGLPPAREAVPPQSGPPTAFLVHKLDARDAEAYRDLTLPGRLRYLTRVTHDPSMVALGSTRFGRPIGLVLAEISPDGAHGTVRSLFVRPGYRRIGVGTALLATLERLLAERGCRSASVTYRPDDPATTALEAIGRRCGWAGPAAGPEPPPAAPAAAPMQMSKVLQPGGLASAASDCSA